VTEPVELHVDGYGLQGEMWIRLEPGTTKQQRDRLLDGVLTEALFEASVQIGAVLSADPHAYAQLTDEVDEDKRTRFVVQGKVEGDRLVPVRLRKRRKR